MSARSSVPAVAVLLSLALASGVSAQSRSSAPPDTLPRQARNWPNYGGDRGGSRYSPLAGITRESVGRLAVAWRFSTGEASAAYATERRTSFEATPLVIDGTMYFITPLGRVFALDAATGKERWRYNGSVVRVAHFGDFTSRGVSYWVDPLAAPRTLCRARIAFATIDARLVELDAATGAPCQHFGDGGIVDLRVGLHTAPHGFEEYEVTSPPAVVSGALVVGSAIADNGRTDAASGEVRAYDARTGALRWTFDPVPRDSADPAFATWRGPSAHRTGAANAWSVIVADTARELVFVPTSSPSPDYYGGERLGDNRYANSVVALRAATGAVAWSFQTVHHDLWDYDNASPPALATVRRQGKTVSAVLLATKTGMLYVLDRETGTPLLGVTERKVPASTVAGETASPTQPFSSIVLSPQSIRPTEVFGVDSADRVACRAALAGLRDEGIFTPPSLEGTLAIPSNIGGAQWGGVAFDPRRHLAIVPVNNIAAVVQLLPRARFDSISAAERADSPWEYAPMLGTPYGMRRRLLVSPAGVPCTPPPFGALVAVDVESGKIVWRVPLGAPAPMAANRMAGEPGASPGRSPFGVRGPAGADSVQLQALGSPNLGGAIVTAGGLAFIAATLDHQLHAFDVDTGRELWRGQLPAAGKATPMTYAVDGRQFVAIAAGGDGGVFGKSDQVVVFALPRPR
jgi:quinoprotein glucose dehydrogenase